MTEQQTAEWRVQRRRRSAGTITDAEWVRWAESYVAGLPDGPWREHCRTHIRFVKRQAGL